MPINFQIDIPQSSSSSTPLFYKKKKIFFFLRTWYNVGTKIGPKTLNYSGSQTLAYIRISKGFVKIDCGTSPPEFLLQKVWIYTSS